nr:MobC family plasmid mobilization relaxosome protein [Leuconostoc gasicomitatum]
MGRCPNPQLKNREPKKVENKQKLKRPIQKIIRFNQEESTYLENKIKASPFKNFQNYARISLLTKEVVFVDYSDLYHLNSEVHRIGNNINQLAKLANSFEDISSLDVQEMTDAIKDLSQLVADKLKGEIRKAHE